MFDFLIPFMCQHVIMRTVFDLKCNMEQLKSIDPNYGVTWMFLPDDQGVPHVVDLTTPNDTSTDGKNFWNNCNDDVTFYFHRQNTRDSPTAFKFTNDPSVPMKFVQTYNPNLPTKFVIHGWQNSISSPVCQQVKDAYLKREDMNVFVVDWSPLAHDTLYFRSAYATRDVGRHVGSLIDRMVTERGTNLDSVHIIGHSLGAHTSGFAGSSINSGKASRVTGLDPALPGFIDSEPDKRLDPSDARFVDVIHTCAGMLGHNKNLGHVDFYPNGGGPNQPGCNGMEDFIGACSHGRSYVYYAESVNRRDGFIAFQCGNMNEFNNKQCQTGPVAMGDAVPIETRGTYYLDTNAEPVFGRGLRR
ncbi:lipase member H-like isoform X4 [Ochlerotatus camptorhynchus]|uniref:lipase member H-like isoform X2 n=1 Tax=Ochlerotatus camptorhynchus TaxID=644619 RepID=UPI0031E281E0